MKHQHSKYGRIHVDGFAEGPVPEEVYRDVVGPAGSAFKRAAQFERAVFKLIDTIDSRRAGRVFLQHLQRVGGSHGIVIMPASLFPPSAKGRPQSATWPGRRRAAHASGSAVRGTNKRGTGAGSSVRISFQFGGTKQCATFGKLDEVLLHELIHACRATTGTQRYVQMPIFNRFEEFVAITITNVYRSEAGRTLRGNHGCSRMAANASQFRRIFHRYFDRLRRETTNAALYRNLGALKTVAWNPFRGFR